jgi:hypothetical protein
VDIADGEATALEEEGGENEGIGGSEDGLGYVWLEGEVAA